MKSIVHEASTIAKAVEQGWKLAGEPREFSIKVLEHPTYNFLGFTTRSAKIAIVFQEQPARAASGRERSREPKREERGRDERDRGREYKREDRERSREERGDGVRTRQQSAGRQAFGRPERPVRERGVETRRVAPQPQQQAPAPQPVQPAVQQPGEQQLELRAAPAVRERPAAQAFWNDEILAFAKTWLTDVLRLMGYADIAFTVEAQQFHLCVVFERPLPIDEARAKHVFASMATLLLAATKKTFRRALRGHKVVITHADAN